MRRTVLLSLVIVGAALAVVFGGTWAAFTDQTVTTGTVASAVINITDLPSPPDDPIDGTAGTPNNHGVYTYAVDGGPLLPGESATQTITIRNIGNRDVHVLLTPVVTSSAEGDCASTNLTVVITPAVVIGQHNDQYHIADGGSQAFLYTATLNVAATNACQNITFTVTTTFDATGVPDAS